MLIEIMYEKGVGDGQGKDYRTNKVITTLGIWWKNTKGHRPDVFYLFIYYFIPLPRESRSSSDSFRWWFDSGTSRASSFCTSPDPVRSCRPCRRSAPHRSPFERICAGTASPTAPECRLSAHQWWSPENPHKPFNTNATLHRVRDIFFLFFFFSYRRNYSKFHSTPVVFVFLLRLI